MVGVVGPAGRLVFDYPDHQGTYCVGRDDPLPVGSHSSDDTENFFEFNTSVFCSSDLPDCVSVQQNMSQP